PGWCWSPCSRSPRSSSASPQARRPSGTRTKRGTCCLHRRPARGLLRGRRRRHHEQGTDGLDRARRRRRGDRRDRRLGGDAPASSLARPRRPRGAAAAVVRHVPHRPRPRVRRRHSGRSLRQPGLPARPVDATREPVASRVRAAVDVFVIGAIAWRQRAPDAERQLIAVWTLAIWALIGLSGIHRARYLFPIYPGLALLAGECLARAGQQGGARELRAAAYAFAALAAAA